MAVRLFSDADFVSRLRCQLRGVLESSRLPVAFPTDDDDADLYDEKTVARFAERRRGVERFFGSHVSSDLYVETIVCACVEISKRREGECSRKLEELSVLEVASDFAWHLIYFYGVAEILDARMEHETFRLRDLPIHDVDKLHPAMLVGYAERFTDGKETSLWKECVRMHRQLNPHHEANAVWQRPVCCCDYPERNGRIGASPFVRSVALREMLCDKISRRVQKQLRGVISNDMWLVEMTHFEGLSPALTDLAGKVLRRLISGEEVKLQEEMSAIQ